MKKVKVTCASSHEDSQTIRVSQFKPLVFNAESEYLIKFEESDETVPAYVNRDAETLYIRGDDWVESMERAQIKSKGGPKYHVVEAVYKKLKGI